VHARGGKDNVDGGYGIDILYGEDGNDTLRGWYDNDLLYGGNGNDRLQGESGADFLYGGAHDDTLLGGVGDDYLDGGDGNDAFDGGDGNDGLWGRSGNDYLRGGTGNDRLGGGTGVDALRGDGGADEFEFYLTSDSGVGAGNRDQVLDFRQQEADKIDVSGMDANATVAGNQTFDWIATTAFAANRPGELRIFAEGNDKIVQGNVDNDADPEFEIEVDNHFFFLGANDFVL
jgi:Ca2+-binding RTX toxin-like protein